MEIAVRIFQFFFFATAAISVATPHDSLSAQSKVAVSPQLQTRANDVLRLLQGEQIEEEVFDENFRNAVPPAQFRALTQQVVAQQGQPKEISAIAARNANSAVLKVRFEKSIGTINVDLERTEPHRISGLLLTGFEAAGNSIGDVVQAIEALPGRNGLLVQPLGDGDKAPIAALDPQGRYAIASAFKLYILAELDRAVRAGERNWSDVVKLGPKSHPSGIMQDWPDDAPVTLHTLATLMISISDNSATDTLIRVIGPERLDAIVSATGHANPEDMRPFLMTRQASALKMSANRDIREQYLASDANRRQKLVANNDDRLSLDIIDPRALTTKPNFIDQIEWFASPADIVHLLDYLRINASEETRKIMAINPGFGENVAKRWDYFGYKGGSEPGVLSFNFLLRSKGGQHYAVSTHWNNSENSLTESELLSLTTRLLNLLAEQ